MQSGPLFHRNTPASRSVHKTRPIHPEIDLFTRLNGPQCPFLPKVSFPCTRPRRRIAANSMGQSGPPPAQPHPLRWLVSGRSSLLRRGCGRGVKLLRPNDSTKRAAYIRAYRGVRMYAPIGSYAPHFGRSHCIGGTALRRRFVQSVRVTSRRCSRLQIDGYG